MNTPSSQSKQYIHRRLRALQVMSLLIVVVLIGTYWSLQRSISASDRLMNSLLRGEEIVRELQMQMHLSGKLEGDSMLTFLQDESASLTHVQEILAAEGLSQDPMVEKFTQFHRDMNELIQAGLLRVQLGGGSQGSLAPIYDGLLFTLDSLYENLQLQQVRIRTTYAERISRDSYFLGGLLLAACVLILLSVRLTRSRVLEPVRILTQMCRAAVGQKGSEDKPHTLIINQDEIGDALMAVESLNTHLQGINDELSKQVTFKSNFVSQISHEIRTPINSIVGLCQLALSESSDVPPRDALKQIDRSAKYLTSLVNHVLDYQKMSSGKLALQRETVNSEAILEGLLIAFEHQAQGKGIGFFVARSLESAQYFVGDQTRIEQILFNLASNAVKFTDKGFVSVSQASAGSDILFTVRDTGIGMTPEDQKRLFEPFFQTQSGVKFGSGGTGLGLTLSMNLAKLMKGDITVESVPGKGSTFTLRLPLEQAPAPESATSNEQPDSLAGVNRPLRVLVVDDHKVNLKVNATLLRNAGFETFMASSGEFAVDMVMDKAGTDEAFDVVLMDVHLNGISGIEASRQLKQALGIQCPVIVPLTAGINPEEAEEMAALGISEILPKPFEVSRAKRLLHDMVNARHTAKTEKV